MMLTLQDGRTIDSDTVAAYDMLLTAMARLELYRSDSIEWVRDHLQEMAVYSTDKAHNYFHDEDRRVEAARAAVFRALVEYCTASIDASVR